MKIKMGQLMDARKRANEAAPVWNDKALGDDETAKQMKQMLEVLSKEAEERERKEKEARENEERDRLECEKMEKELEQKMKEEEQRRKEEEECKRKQLEEDPTLGDKPTGEAIQKVLNWIAKQEMEKKQEDSEREKLRALQEQVEKMAKGENRRSCITTGVNMFANLDALQGDGATGIDPATKAHNAMIASTAEKCRVEGDLESEGESLHSNPLKKHKLTSGLGRQNVQKIKFEVEWAHHWLGKEFEANPIPFNQIKLGHFVMGEAEILAKCTKPEEFCARLKLMQKLGYWQIKYDWPSARNVYAAILKGIEMGREGWDFDLCDYEDMLNPGVVINLVKMVQPKRPQDVFFCAEYQRGMCSLEGPHMAKVGNDGVDKLVHHVCSSCLLKDGK